MITQYINHWASNQYFSPAIHHRDTTINYGQLANAIAETKEELLRCGVMKGARVLLDLDKSPELLVLVYSLLDIGACYIPIGRKSKSHDVVSIGVSSNANFYVTEGAVGTSHKGIKVLSKMLGFAMFETNGEKNQSLTHEASVAAILFTSGSTGIAKGVMISVEALSEFLQWASEYFDVNNLDCFANHADLHFDISFFDIYLPMMHGASVVLFDAVYQKNPLRMIADVTEKRVTIWQSVPSVLSMLRMSAEQHQLKPITGIRGLFFSGELIPMRTLSFVKAFFPNARIINGYGCTETNDTFVYEVNRNKHYKTLPIGQPVDYTSIVVLDKEGHECSAGQVGELYVSGATLLLGYTNSELDVDSLILRNDQHGEEVRYYKTGDLVRRDKNGDYCFVSRIDAVVKIRGNRVNLYEVETCIGDIPGVESCIVIPVETIDDGLTSVALLQQASSANLRSISIRTYLSKHLPASHIPKTICIQSNAFVLNKNGKIDRKAMSDAYHRELCN